MIYLWFRITVHRTRRIRVRPFLNMKLSKSHSRILLVFLVISGDVQVNPGPLSSITAPPELPSECTKTLWQLYRTKTKVIAGKLHQNFLSLYEDRKLIPPGLNIKLTPQVGALPSNRYDKWNNILRETSLQLMEILIQAQKEKCAALVARLESKQSTLTDHLESSELVISIDWRQTQTKIFRDQLYIRKFQKIQQHLSRSTAVSAHQITQRTTTPEMSVTEPLRAENNKTTHVQPDHPQISATKIQRTTPNTAKHTQPSKPPISGPHLHRAKPNAATHLQPNKPPEVTTPKRHRRKHRGIGSNTKRRANHQQTVINLSDRVLTEQETNILSKGLKFVPTPTSVNRTELTADVKKWSRRMRLKEFFGPQTTRKMNKKASKRSQPHGLPAMVETRPQIATSMQLKDQSWTERILAEENYALTSRRKKELRSMS